MMDYSCFSDNQQSCLAEPLPVSGFICEAYRVKIYGKLHFLKKLKNPVIAVMVIFGQNPSGDALFLQNLRVSTKIINQKSP